MEKGIRTEHFAVGYGKEILIGDICLKVEPGKILTFIGPNGSGKSTILKSLTRQLPSMGGAVYLDGKTISHMKESELAQHMSMVMTERIKPELMTCQEVAATGRYPYTGRLGILTRQDWDAVDEAMALCHVTELSGQDFLKISDGQKQRVMLARAVCQSPKILILDEPTSYLDMKYKLDILVNIRKLARERKVSVIMSLHELDLAQKVSDTIACVDGEKICCVGTPEEIFCGHVIQDLYGVAEDSFDTRLGSMQLPANHEPPKVFVICGGGTGIPLFYRLQRDNIPFAAGILWENDIDYAIGKAVAGRVISEKAFSPIGEAQIALAKKIIDQCEACICTLKEFGIYNEANRILAEYAAKKTSIL